MRLNVVKASVVVYTSSYSTIKEIVETHLFGNSQIALNKA